MLELASLGAKVLQIRSVEIAMKYGVPVHVRSAFSESQGTWVTGEDKTLEDVVVAGVAYDKNESRVIVIGLEDKPGVVADLVKALGLQGRRQRRPFTPIFYRDRLAPLSAARFDLRASPSCAPCRNIWTSFSCWLPFEHDQRTPSLSPYILLLQS